MNRYRLVYDRIDDETQKLRTIDVEGPWERPTNMQIVNITPDDCSDFLQVPCEKCQQMTGGEGLPFISTPDGRFCHTCWTIQRQPLNETAS